MSFNNILPTDYDRGHLVAIIKHFVQTTIRCNAQSIDIYRQVFNAYGKVNLHQMKDAKLYWLLNKHDLENIISEFERDVILAKKSFPYQYSVSESHSLPSSAENLIKEVKEMIEERKKFIRSQIELMLKLIKFWRGIDCESGFYLIPLANLFSTSSFDNILDFERDVMAPWGNWSQNAPFSSEISECGRVITIPQLQQYLQEVPVIVVPEGVSPEKVQKLDIVFREMHSLAKQMNEQNKNWTTTLVGRTFAKPHKHTIDDQNVLFLTSNEEASRDVRDDGKKTTERSSRQNPVDEAVEMENDAVTAIMKKMYNLSLENTGEVRQKMANPVPEHTVQPANAPVGNSNTENSSMLDVLLFSEFICYRNMDDADRQDEFKVGLRMRLFFEEKILQFRQANVSLNFEASRKKAYEYIRRRLEALRLRRADQSEGPSKEIEAKKHAVEWRIEELSAVLGKYATLMRDHLRWDHKTVAILLMLDANAEDFHHYILESYCLFTVLA